MGWSERVSNPSRDKCKFENRDLNPVPLTLIYIVLFPPGLSLGWEVFAQGSEVRILCTHDADPWEEKK